MAYNPNNQYFGNDSAYDFGSFDYGQQPQQQVPQQDEKSTGGFSRGTRKAKRGFQSQQQPAVAPAPQMYNPLAPPVQPSTNLFTPNYDTDPFGASGGQPGADPFADEPPLLEELGINFDHIHQKTIAVLNPFAHPDPTILHDSDLAGPLVFGLAFGSLLLLAGKVIFGYIYGFGLFGSVAIYALLNLMSPPNLGLSFSCTVSVLGYCLLPMVILSAIGILINLKAALVGSIFALAIILWCAISASKLFVIALSMHNAQTLVAYPCALLYGVFALLTIF